MSDPGRNRHKILEGIKLEDDDSDGDIDIEVSDHHELDVADRCRGGGEEFEKVEQKKTKKKAVKRNAIVKTDSAVKVRTHSRSARKGKGTRDIRVDDFIRGAAKYIVAAVTKAKYEDVPAYVARKLIRVPWNVVLDELKKYFSDQGMKAVQEGFGVRGPTDRKVEEAISKVNKVDRRYSRVLMKLLVGMANSAENEELATGRS